MSVVTRALLATGLSLALVACGGGDEPEETAATVADGEAVFVGTDAIAWGEESKAAVAVDGGLEVTLQCDGTVPHNLLIEGVTGDDGEDAVLAECADSSSATADVELEPGTYTFYCNIPGHRAAGMVGELTVS